MRFDHCVSLSLDRSPAFSIGEFVILTPKPRQRAITRLLIVPRKDELWQTSFAGRHSLLEDTIDDELPKQCNNKGA